MFAHEDIGDAKIEAWLADSPAAELRPHLTWALESLPPHYLEIVLLRDFEELTMSEIGERLGISLAATKARLRRAREFVREYLIDPERTPAKTNLKSRSSNPTTR